MQQDGFHVLPCKVISTVNLAEIASKLNDLSAPETFIQDGIKALNLTIVDFNMTLAYKVGFLRPLTRRGVFLWVIGPVSHLLSIFVSPL